MPFLIPTSIQCWALCFLRLFVHTCVMHNMHCIFVCCEIDWRYRMTTWQYSIVSSPNSTVKLDASKLQHPANSWNCTLCLSKQCCAVTAGASCWWNYRAFIKCISSGSSPGREAGVPSEAGSTDPEITRGSTYSISMSYTHTRYIKVPLICTQFVSRCIEGSTYM